MKRGGDLDALINDELGSLSRLLYEEAVRERDDVAASPEADFPPCGLSEMPSDAPVEERTPRPQDSHHEGDGVL
jgi:hypothetical protein